MSLVPDVTAHAWNSWNPGLPSVFVKCPAKKKGPALVQSVFSMCLLKYS